MSTTETINYLKEHVSRFNKFKYSPGDGNEFGKPETLIGYLENNLVELNVITGSSWFISGYEGVRIYTLCVLFTPRHVSRKIRTNICKFIDVFGDPDKLVDWINNYLDNVFKKSKNSDIWDEHSNLSQWLTASENNIMKVATGYGKRLRAAGLCKSSTEKRKNNTLYIIDDVDRSFSVLCCTITLPYVKPSEFGQRSISIIFQVRKDKDTGKISTWMTKRELLKQRDGYTSITELKPEVDVSNYREDPSVIYDRVLDIFVEEAEKLKEDVTDLKAFLKIFSGKK